VWHLIIYLSSQSTERENPSTSGPIETGAANSQLALATARNAHIAKLIFGLDVGLAVHCANVIVRIEQTAAIVGGCVLWLNREKCQHITGKDSIL